MSRQKFAQYVVLALISLFVISVEYTYQTTEYKATEPTVIASGVVTERFENDYACGSKGRYTCYARYLEINGQRHQVNDDVFKNNSIGSSVTLIKTIDPDVTLWQDVSRLIHAMMLFIAFASSVAMTDHFLIWACFYSDKYTYKEQLKNLFS